MTERTSEDRQADILAALVFRPVSLDDFASVRHVHTTALRMLAASQLADDEIQAFIAFVQSPAYVDKLVRQSLHATWFGDQMLGTAGWSAADDTGGSARIESVFVRPPFARLGVGRRLVGHVEGLARIAGFTAYTVRATMNAVSFFERLGYLVVSHGQQLLTPEQPLPVAFMRKWDGKSRPPRKAPRALHEIH